MVAKSSTYHNLLATVLEGWKPRAVSQDIHMTVCVYWGGSLFLHSTLLFGAAWPQPEMMVTPYITRG